MTIKPAVAGDIGDYRIIQLNGIDSLGTVAAVEAHVSHDGTVETLAATVEDANDCTVRVELGEAAEWLPSLEEIASAQSWKFEVQATFANGDVLTWPAKTPDQIGVRPQLDVP